MKYSLAAFTLFAFLLTGCGGSHRTYVGPAPQPNYDTEEIKQYELRAISARYQQGNGMLPGDNGIESIYYALQLAAEDTLKNEKKYFAIYRPIAISDFDDKGFGSPEAFRDKCIIEAAPASSAIAKQAQFTHSYCGTTQVLSSHLEIVEFAEKPENVTVYDAEKTLEMIKKDGHYTKGGNKMVDAPRLVNILAPMGMNYDAWFNSRRSDPNEIENQETVSKDK